jgi:thioredoxin
MNMSPVFDTPITTNDLSLDRVLAVRLPIMLVFLDSTNQQNVEPQLKQIAREFSGQILVAKILTNDNPESTRRYQIRQTPAVVSLNDGQVMSKGEGLSADSVRKHALFLTGKGPEPAQETVSKSSPAGFQPSSNGKVHGAHRANSQPQTVTDNTFDQEVLGSPIPVLVDFWAPWCGPCRMTEPVLEKLAREMPGTLLIAKVNVDENPHLSNRFGIQSIPTMMVVKNGKVIDRWMGALPEQALRNRLSQALR